MRLMRIFTAALAMVALTALPQQAMAQAKRPNPQEKKQEKKPEIDEKAYKAALERIPEPKEKYDPWSGARPNEPAKNVEVISAERQGQNCGNLAPGRASVIWRTVEPSPSTL